MNPASSFWSVLCALKMYASKQISSMLGQLWGRGWWEPPIKVLDPVDQLDIVSGANVMSGMDASSVRVDRKDVWTHGEQFVNCGTAEHPYTLPVATGPTWWLRPLLRIFVASIVLSPTLTRCSLARRRTRSSASTRGSFASPLRGWSPTKRRTRLFGINRQVRG